MKGSFEHIHHLEEVYEKVKKQPREDKTVELVEDDDEEENEKEDEIDDRGKEQDSAVRDAMDVEPQFDNRGPITDEDGFQLVQGKTRRRRR